MSPPKDEEDIPLVPPQQTVQTSTQVEALRTAEEEELASKKKSVRIQSEQAEALLAAYKQHCGAKWFKDHPPERDENGRLSLSFKSDEDMASFFEKQAKSGQSFIMIDAETNKVIAYSNGDGKLYQTSKNGPKEYTGGSLTPNKEAMNDLPDFDGFTLPAKGEPQEEMGARLQ
ncbi:hypothetical protein [Fluoribacter gormanii]|uniref:hypothetical protein n=1 Tax=Fluoribacter gormanii TaxID=464 RepID=UPI001A943105|nr:hypothetical protein [Fluoribacter gormanii]